MDTKTVHMQDELCMPGAARGERRPKSIKEEGPMAAAGADDVNEALKSYGYRSSTTNFVDVSSMISRVEARLESPL